MKMREKEKHFCMEFAEKDGENKLYFCSMPSGVRIVRQEGILRAFIMKKPLYGGFCGGIQLVLETWRKEKVFPSSAE